MAFAVVTSSYFVGVSAHSSFLRIRGGDDDSSSSSSSFDYETAICIPDGSISHMTYERKKSYHGMTKTQLCIQHHGVKFAVPYECMHGAHAACCTAGATISDVEQDTMEKGLGVCQPAKAVAVVDDE